MLQLLCLTLITLGIWAVWLRAHRTRQSDVQCQGSILGTTVDICSSSIWDELAHFLREGELDRGEVCTVHASDAFSRIISTSSSYPAVTFWTVYTLNLDSFWCSSYGRPHWHFAVLVEPHGLGPFDHGCCLPLCGHSVRPCLVRA